MSDIDSMFFSDEWWWQLYDSYCCGLMCRNYRSKFQNEETELFCMRVMVGVIILYDHVHPVGAFSKGSSIDVSIASI